MIAKYAAAIISLLFLFSMQAFSQRSRRNGYTPFSSETQFAAGPELAAVFPSGIGIGASVRYEQPLRIINNLTVTATAGLIAYGTSATYGTGNGTTYTAKTRALFIPVLGGAKYYYPGPIFRGLYGSLEAGFGFGSSSVSYTGSIPAGPLIVPARAGGITVCPGAGFHNGTLDFSLRYFSVGLVSIRAVYVFKLGRGR